MSKKIPVVITLNNGVRLVMHDMPHTQTISVAAFVNTGSRNEIPEWNGISHFIEHMAFKGTKKRDYKKISQDVERLGAEINAYTSKDTTAYFVTGMMQHAFVFIDLIGDIFCNSAFPPEQIEVERGVVLQEYKSYADDPASVANHVYDAVSYPDDALGRKILGEPKNIKSFTRDNLLAYVAGQYTGNNTIVTVVGNLGGAENDIIDAVTVVFGNLPCLDAAYKRTVPTYVGGCGVQKKATEQVSVILGFESVNELHKLQHATHVAVELLGGGLSSPLFDEIREKRGLAYSVGSAVDMGIDHGTFYVHAGTTPENITEFLNAALDVIFSCTEKIDKVDLERAKNSVNFRISRGMERPFGVAQAAASDLFTHGHVQDAQDEIARINAVTPAQVKKVLKNLLSAAPTISVVGKGANPKDADVYKNVINTRIMDFLSRADDK